MSKAKRRATGGAKKHSNRVRTTPVSVPEQMDGKIRKIVILGAGTVGRHIATLLQRESVNVILVDNDRQKLHEVAEGLDIQTIHGNGANPDILERAGIRDAQLLLGLTDSCEVNLLAAFIAKEMGVAQTVVRSRAMWSLDTSRVNLRESLKIDLLMNPELLTAMEIAAFLDNPDSLAMTQFAHGKVEMRQFRLDSDSDLCGQTLMACGKVIPSGVLVATRVRDDEVVIPKGNHTLEAGDKLTLIGLPNRLQEAQELFHTSSTPLRHVTIAGGGTSGLVLARTLEDKNFNVTLVEPNAEQCEYLSERLQHTTIIRGDVTRLGFMQEERIGSSDVFIALMGNDEDNLMACLLAKGQGVKQTVARTNRPDYASLVQKMGVDLALSPRHIMADRIMALVLGGRIKAISLMEEGKVEAIEFLAEQKAPFMGRPLMEVGKLLPDGVLICAIVRHGHVIVPGGQDEIRLGDTVIVVGMSELMDEIEAMFQGRQ